MANAGGYEIRRQGSDEGVWDSAEQRVVAIFGYTDKKNAQSAAKAWIKAKENGEGNA
jgi:hypothetical protein